MVLVLLSGDCREAYWVKFDLARTEETASGWWIEVPKENLLNSQIADTWASIAGPIQDYSEQIQSFWAFGKVVRSADFLLIAIPKSDVAEKSMYTINTVLERLQSNKELLLKKRGAVEIFFPDWDDDPREIYEIPEIRGWMSASFEAGIPWFYFLNSQFPFHSLKIILACGCSVSSLETAVGGYMLSTEAEDRSRWLEANFHNLNCFTESNSIDVLINKELCEGVMSALFGMPPIGDVVDP